MAFRTRFLQHNVLRKFSYAKLIWECGQVLPGIHKTQCARDGKELYCSYRFFRKNHFDKFASISNAPVRPVTNISEEEIVNASIKYPELSQHPKGQLQKFLSDLTNFGFSADDGVEMIVRCQDILGKSVSEMFQVISSFRRCKLKDEEIISTLKCCPQHFCANPDTIVARYFSLRDKFSQTQTLKIFSTCPSIMTTKWNNIQEKIEYMKKDMCAQNGDIARSSALEYPLDFIKTRHIFLERAGLFEIPDPKSNIPHKNPNLSNVITTDDVYFAEEVAGLTTEEYSVFLAMLKFEKQSQEEAEDDESDSD